MEELTELLDTNFGYVDEIRAEALAQKIIDAGYVKVIRCRDCVHGCFERQGMCACIKDADIDDETGAVSGFVDYHETDFFCAAGERK